MRRYFGTDGIRGIANDTLTCTLAFQCGNALTMLKEKPTVVVGKDTRVSGDMIALSFASGVISGGGNVRYLGIITTPAVALETTKTKADFGVVISASHNPAKYNGIKIFGSDGYKLSDDSEEEIEKCLGENNFVAPQQIGKMIYCEDPTSNYIDSLVNSIDVKLSGLKVVIDCSNGAGSVVAPKVFSQLGADVIAIHNETSGENINLDCGCLYPKVVAESVVKNKADIGVSLDGDADRLMICDSDGNIINGDKILYILANYYKANGLLNGNFAIGTHHTNMAIENALTQSGIRFLRSDIGDRYVIELMKSTGAVLGGEQSGHIIIGNQSTTGDGILTALMLCEVMLKTGKSLSQLSNVENYPQENINVKVVDKSAIMANEQLHNEIAAAAKQLGTKGRVLVRPSGTEAKIRVMVECEDAQLAKSVATGLANLINEIGNMDSLEVNI